MYKFTMNRFLTKKKAKRAQPEPKFQLDLTSALPSSDNFRTSLLMPNLSARFSMLREQDDPNSILGKAMDDSVLQPKRQSRLYDFGFQSTGLSDIAEVSSINGSIRPPFAESERSNSYSSEMGYNTDGDDPNGSVMDRTRTREGNILFGGRQKITRIAGDGKGRTLYDDDVAMSTFQKFRQEERQREKEAALRQQQMKGSMDEERKSPTKPGSYATSVAGSLRRQTSSSTATSGIDSRASTAATSIISQGHSSGPLSAGATVSTFNFGPSVTNAASNTAPVQPQNSTVPSTTQNTAPALERAPTKRRLYDQSLDRDIHEQQTSAMSRLHSIQKGRGINANGRSTPEQWSSRNGFAPAERSLQNAAEAPRARSPSPVSPLERRPTIKGLPGKDIKLSRSNTNTGKVSPLSGSPPPTANEERQDVLASSIDPNDRGKATAMGVFNKPKQFNEQQFLERQLTLRKGRETPTPTFGLRSDAVLESPKESEEFDRNEASQFSSNRSDRPADNWARDRSESNGPFNTTRSPPDHEPPEPPTGFSVFQKAANQMKAAEAQAPVQAAVDAPVQSRMPALIPIPLPNAPAAAPSLVPMPAFVQVSSKRNDSSQLPARNRFNFVDDSESDYEDEQPVAQSRKRAPSPKPVATARTQGGARMPNGKPIIPHDKPMVPPPQHEHPAFRNTPQPSREDLRAESRKPSVDTPKASNLSNGTGNVDRLVESPTLGVEGAGLSGLVQSHLRNISATSSYSTATAAGPPPAFPIALQTSNLNAAAPQASASSDNTAHSSYNNSNPWDLEDFDDSYADGVPRNSLDDIKISDKRAPETHSTNMTSSTDSARELSWQQELSKKTHTRGGSSETHQEREALASELAMRQKAIQEKLREKAQSNSRSGSPAPKAGAFKGMLRNKSSLDNFRNRQGSDKGMRSNGPSNGSPPLGSTTERPSWETERSNAPRSVPIPMPAKEHQQAGYGQTTPGSQNSSRPGTGRNSSEDKMRSRANSNANSAAQQRSRSNSEHSNGRSQSRSGRYRDDLAQAMAEGGSSSRGTIFNDPALTIPEDFPPQQPAPDHPIPQIPESPTQTKYKPAEPAYFEQKGLWPPPQNPIVHPLGAPSPRSFGPNGALSPALSSTHSPRPSPGLGPLSPGMMSSSGRSTPLAAFANPTPPLSASSTPITSSFSSSTPNLTSGTNLRMNNRQRKMSIKKSDIGEPVLISTTSVVDTIALPAGASLRNGIFDAPPVPPINPRRKRFGFGRGGDVDPPEPQFLMPSTYRSHSSDEKERPRVNRHRLKKSSSDGAKIGLYIRAEQESFATQSTPALQHLQTSPPRMQNGMF